MLYTIGFNEKMLQTAYNDFFNPKAHKSERQILLFPLQIKQVKVG